MKPIFISSTSACFELQNDAPFFAPTPFDVYLNDRIVLTNIKNNVFSLFSLLPDTEYKLTAGEKTLVFKTLSESTCLNVKDFGANGDGVTNDTFAIQKCIVACPDNGRVFVPAGEYQISPISLKSNITLELAENCRLIGSSKETDYPVIDAYYENGNVLSLWEGNACAAHQSLISGYDLQNVKIIGKGTIDGNAPNSTWWDLSLLKKRTIARPRLVFLNNCKNVTFHGIIGTNSASWNFHPFLSEQINFYNVSVITPGEGAPNTDGIDPDCCNGVNIIGCRFSTGDDCIAIKSGKIDLAFQLKKPADNHTIRNCYMQDGHGGVVLGSEISGGVKNLSVSKCIFDGTHRGLRIKTRRGRGKYCIIDGVEFENIEMRNVRSPLVINMYYNCDPDGNTEYVYSREHYPVDERTPYLGKFTFRNIRCSGCETAAGYFDGLPEQPIKEILLENLSFRYNPESKGDFCAMMTHPIALRNAGFYFDNVEKAIVNNVSFSGIEDKPIIAKNCREIRETNVSFLPQ